MGSAPIGALTCSQACVPLSAPPRAAAWAPTKLSNKPYADRPSLTRVEQLPNLRRPDILWRARSMVDASPFDNKGDGT